MTEGHLPPEASGALPRPAAGQPAPAPSPGGPAPPGTSPMAIASAACGAGALILLGESLREAFLAGGTPGPLPPVQLLSPLLGIAAGIAAVVLGAIVQVRVRRTKRRGTGLALSGLILGGAMLPLLCIRALSVGMAIACHGLCIHD